MTFQGTNGLGWDSVEDVHFSLFLCFLKMHMHAILEPKTASLCQVDPTRTIPAVLSPALFNQHHLTLEKVVSACRLAWDAMFNGPKHPGTQIGIHCTCTYRCPNCWTGKGTGNVNGLWNLDSTLLHTVF